VSSTTGLSADRWPAGLVFGAAVVGVAIVAAALTVSGPIAVGVLAGAFLVVAFTVRFADALPALFLNGMTVLLAGYALFGRSFAYVGVPPVYVGEIALAAGALTTLFITRNVLQLMALRQTWLLFALAAWSACQTVPYVSTYRMDALRDAVLWGYGGFAVMFAAVVLSTDQLGTIVARYGRAILLFVAWVPVLYALVRLFGDYIPTLPGTEVALLSFKMGDAGVHLAGAAAFALTFGTATTFGAAWSQRQKCFFWAAWIAGVACVLAQNRGGFLAVVAAVAVLAAVNPMAIGRRIAVGVGIVTIVVGSLALALTLDGNASPAGSSDDRTLSGGQFVANLASIVSPDADYVLGESRQWRLDWWAAIREYTLWGEYFWTGKGFGVNLADDDGYRGASEDAPLRSPHNAHMTFLARAGVPGIALWILLNVTFAVGLLRAYARARRLGASSWAHLDLWLLAYWTAFLTNASFDVFLEGPQGGIWFWCVFGLGLASLAAQRSLGRDGVRGATG